MKRSDLLFNGPTPIPAGELGQAQAVFPLTAAYTSPAGVMPMTGIATPVGVVAGDWLLRTDATGFSIKALMSQARGLAVITPMAARLDDVVIITGTPPGDPVPAEYWPASVNVFDPVGAVFNDQSIPVWFRPFDGATGPPTTTGYIGKGALCGYGSGRPVYVGPPATNPSGSTSVCTGCGWLAGLRQIDCPNVSVGASGGGGNPVNLSSADAIHWSSGTGTVTVCGRNYIVSFTATSPPAMTITSTDSSSVSYTGTFDCCGCDYATFTFHLQTLCPSSAWTGDACTNVVKFTVTWNSCCVILGWGGPGWYCVTEAGTDCSGAVVVNLLDSEKCDSSIKICSGPYATEAAAAAVCPSSDVGCGCVGGNQALKFKFTLSGITNGTCSSCGLLNGTFILTGSLPDNPCTWNGDIIDYCNLGPGCEGWEMLYIGAETVLNLSQDCGTLPWVRYTKTGAWDCVSPITLTLSSVSHTYCVGFPPTITLYPVG